MGSKIFIKISILFVALAMVYGATRFFTSTEFKSTLTELFGNGLKTYAWCPDHAVDFEWLDSQISVKWKAADWTSIQKRFCRLTMEPIQNIDLTQVKFVPLLKVQSAHAKVAHLEWNAGLNVFRANGLPFYSTSLAREILDR